MTRHLLFLICAWSASIVACCIHEGHARAQCSKERNDQSQHPHDDANGTKHLRGWQLIRDQNTLPLKHLSSFQVQPRNHQNQLTPTVRPTSLPQKSCPPSRTASRHHSTKAVTSRRSPGFPLPYRRWNRPTAMQHTHPRYSLQTWMERPGHGKCETM